MERNFSPEYEKNDIDFLDESLKINLVISPEIEKSFPVITKEDYEIRTERYRFLLGSWMQGSDGQINVEIKAVISAPQYYKEQTDAIGEVDYPGFKNELSVIKNSIGNEVLNVSLIGDFHTHLIRPEQIRTPDELEQIRQGVDVKIEPPPAESWHPSQADREGLECEYLEGLIPKDQPFVMGIAGLSPRGEQKYGFYRMFKDKEFGYQLSEIDSIVVKTAVEE